MLSQMGAKKKSVLQSLQTYDCEVMFTLSVFIENRGREEKILKQCHFTHVKRIRQSSTVTHAIIHTNTFSIKQHLNVLRCLCLVVEF